MSSLKNKPRAPKTRVADRYTAKLDSKRGTWNVWDKKLSEWFDPDDDPMTAEQAIANADRRNQYNRMMLRGLMKREDEVLSIASELPEASLKRVARKLNAIMRDQFGKFD